MKILKNSSLNAAGNIAFSLVGGIFALIYGIAFFGVMIGSVFMMGYFSFSVFVIYFSVAALTVTNIIIGLKMMNDPTGLKLGWLVGSSAILLFILWQMN